MVITLEEIQKKFEDLPENLKWAIMAANVDDNIIDIGQAQNLNVEQMGQLSLETYMVMFGFTHPDQFEKSVKDSLKFSDEKTRMLVNAVNEKILKEIRENLKESFSKTPAKEPESQEKSDTQVLGEHGIEIINEKEILPVPEKLELGNGQEEPHPILAQKLSSSVQTPVVKTEHTLENITKTNESNQPAQKTSKPAIDPYREIPE